MDFHKPLLNIVITLCNFLEILLFKSGFVYRIPCHTKVQTLFVVRFVFLFFFSFGCLVLIKKTSLSQDCKSSGIFFKKNIVVIQFLIHEMKGCTKSVIPKHSQSTGSPEELVKNSFS